MNTTPPPEIPAALDALVAGFARNGHTALEYSLTDPNRDMIQAAARRHGLAAYGRDPLTSGLGPRSIRHTAAADGPTRGVHERVAVTALANALQAVMGAPADRAVRAARRLLRHVHDNASLHLTRRPD